MQLEIPGAADGEATGEDDGFLFCVHFCEGGDELGDLLTSGLLGPDLEIVDCRSNERFRGAFSPIVGEALDAGVDCGRVGGGCDGDAGAAFGSIDDDAYIVAVFGSLIECEGDTLDLGEVGEEWDRRELGSDVQSPLLLCLLSWAEDWT